MSSVPGNRVVNHGNPCRGGSFSIGHSTIRDTEVAMNNTIYLVGLVVVVGFIASFVL